MIFGFIIDFAKTYILLNEYIYNISLNEFIYAISVNEYIYAISLDLYISIYAYP